MIITITGADFSKSNIGTLNSWTVSKSIGAGANHSIPSFVTKGAQVSWTITLAAGYTFGSYEIKMGGSTITPTVNGNTMTINLTVTGNVVIKVPTINEGTGEEVPPVTPEQPGTGGDNITGWTQISLNSDASNWVLATVSAAGVGTDGSSNKRLTYNQVFDIPSSQRLKVVCDTNYQWGIRNGESETNFKNNQFWLNSGDELQLAHSPAGGKFMLIFRKCTTQEPPFARSTDPSGIKTITKSDVATINPKLYYKDSYTSEFDITSYQYVMDLPTDESKWIRATVGDNGPGAANSSTTRLTYNTMLDASILQEKDVVLITCAAGYQWGIRSSKDGGTTFSNNSYWFNPGTCIRLSTSGIAPIPNGTATNFYIVFRKAKTGYNGVSGTGNDGTITFTDLTSMNAKLYTAKPYSA